MYTSRGGGGVKKLTEAAELFPLCLSLSLSSFSGCAEEFHTFDAQKLFIGRIDSMCKLKTSNSCIII